MPSPKEVKLAVKLTAKDNEIAITAFLEAERSDLRDSHHNLRVASQCRNLSL
jgi:hypothetical protein